MNLSDKLTDKLLKMQIINSEEKELYYYGLKQGFLLLLNMMTVIIIGFIFNMIWQSVIFVITYSLLRAYAGGYHASTQAGCYLFSLVMIISVLWLIKLIPWNGFIIFIITIVASMIILIIAPVEDSNKPLDQKEKVIFKKRTNSILSVLAASALLFWLIDVNLISICMVMGICIISIMIVLGKIKNMIEGKEYI